MVCVQLKGNLAVSGAGFDEFREMYASHPNVLLCVCYICDVGRVIVSGTDATAERPRTRDVNHHLLHSSLSLNHRTHTHTHNWQNIY